MRPGPRGQQNVKKIYSFHKKYKCCILDAGNDEYIKHHNVDGMDWCLCEVCAEIWLFIAGKFDIYKLL